MKTPASAAISRPESVRNHARELCSAMAAIHRRGWCEGTGGNFSCVISREPLQLLMAPSGVDKGAVRASHLIVVDEGGQVVEGDGRVSAEMALHREIVRSTGAGAVLHTHSQAATLLSLQAMRETNDSTNNGRDHRDRTAPTDVDALSAQSSADGHTVVAHLEIEGLEMLKGLEGIQTHESRIQIPVLANDQDLPRLSGRAHPHLSGPPHGILIAGHGLYAWGADLRQAMRHLEILEFLLEQHWRQRLWNALVNRSA